MQIYATEQLSKSRSRTPEGYLLITGTPIARTGTQIYGPDETPIKPVNGVVRILREADEVFRPQTIESANGKSYVDDHPEDDVVPKTWSDLTLGVFFNARRGTGAEDDLLLADLLVTTARGIELVESGKTELSCGYDAKYAEVSPGVGRQYDITINHIASVDQGRCGLRCKIGDKAMAKATTWDRLMKTFGVKDEAELKEKLDKAEDAAPEGSDEGDDHTHIHVHMPNGGDSERVETADETPPWFKKHMETMDARFKAHDEDIGTMKEMLGKWAKQEGDEPEHKTGDEDEPDNEAMVDKKAKDAAKKARDDKEIEGELEEEAPEGTGDKATKAKDSAYLVDSFQDTVAMAELIVPGIAIPTFDRKAGPKDSLKNICAFRRRTLDLAYVAPETRQIIDEINGNRTFDTKAMSCAATRSMFRSVGAARRRANNGAAYASRTNDSAQRGGTTAPIRTVADLNRYYEQQYKA